jgi:hypothetical protein
MKHFLFLVSVTMAGTSIADDRPLILLSAQWVCSAYDNEGHSYTGQGSSSQEAANNALSACRSGSGASSCNVSSCYQAG